MPELVVKSLVGIIMGSMSDWDLMRHTADIGDNLGIPNDVRVISAHRTPDMLFEYASGAINATLLAAAILGNKHPQSADALTTFSQAQTERGMKTPDPHETGSPA